MRLRLIELLVYTIGRENIKEIKQNLENPCGKIKDTGLGEDQRSLYEAMQKPRFENLNQNGVRRRKSTKVAVERHKKHTKRVL